MRRSAGIILLLMLFVWSLATLVVTLLPGGGIGTELPFAAAKLGHVLLFGGWALLAGLSVAALRGIQRLNLRLLWIAAFGFGAAIELAQTLLPVNREGSLRDIVINAVGVSAACLILRRLRRRWTVTAPDGQPGLLTANGGCAGRRRRTSATSCAPDHRS